jgi:hypothetical protein
MSTDGRYVAFESFASNLVSGDNNSAWDIFVRDRGVGTSPPYPLATSTEEMEGTEEPEEMREMEVE